MLRLLLLLLIVFTTSLESEERESDETIWLKSPKQFKCTPNEITRKDSVTIFLGENSFKELAVFRKADNTWLFLVVGSAPPEMDSLMTPADLNSAKKSKVDFFYNRFSVGA